MYTLHSLKLFHALYPTKPSNPKLSEFIAFRRSESPSTLLTLDSRSSFDVSFLFLGFVGISSIAVIMAPIENEGPPSDSSSNELTTILVNGIHVPLLKGISNYGAWRAKFEEAVKTNDPISWRILNGDGQDPISDMNALVSEQSFARIGAAKRLKIDPKSVTDEEPQGFLDALRAEGPLIRADYAGTLRSKLMAKKWSARDLILSAFSEGIRAPYFVDDLPGWAQRRFSSTGYLAQADVCERWLNLRFESVDQGTCEYRRAFTRKFKRMQNQLEERTGVAIPLEAEICHFIVALQNEPEEQADFVEAVQNAPSMGFPYATTIYVSFAGFSEEEMEEW